MAVTRSSHYLNLEVDGAKKAESELKAVDAADKKVASSLNEVSAASDKASRGLSSVAASAATASAGGGFGKLKGAFDAVTGTAGKALGALNGLGDAFKLVGMGVGVGALFGGLQDIVEVSAQLITAFDGTAKRLESQILYYATLTTTIDEARNAAANLAAAQASAYSTAYLASLKLTGAGGPGGKLAADLAQAEAERKELLDYIATTSGPNAEAAIASGFMSTRARGEQAAARLEAQQLRDKLREEQMAANLAGLQMEAPVAWSPQAQAGFKERWGAQIDAIKAADRFAQSLDLNVMSVKESETEILRLTEKIENLNTELTKLTTAAQKATTAVGKPAPTPKAAPVEDKPTGETLTFLLGALGAFKPVDLIKEVGADFAALLEARQAGDKADLAEVERDRRAKILFGAADKLEAQAQAAIAANDGLLAQIRLYQLREHGKALVGMVSEAPPGSKLYASPEDQFESSVQYVKMLDEALTGLQDRALITAQQAEDYMAPMLQAVAAGDHVKVIDTFYSIADAAVLMEERADAAWENMVGRVKAVGWQMADEAMNIAGVLADTVGVFTQGIGNMMTNMILAGDAGWKSQKKAAGNALAGISAQAFGYATLLTALGTAAALGVVSLPAAPGLFAAAGVMAASGVALAGTARALGADPIGGAAGGAGSKSGGGKAAGTTFQSLAPKDTSTKQDLNVTVVLSDEGLYDGMVRVEQRRSFSGSLSRPRLAGAV